MKNLDEIIDIIYDPNIPITEELINKINVSEKTANRILALNNQLDFNTLQNKMFLKQHESGIDSIDVVFELRKSLKNTLKESKNSQLITKLMYVFIFLLGFGLIGFAIYFGIQGKNILAITFGAFGMLNIVTLLIQDPPLKLQDSRSNYAQLTVGMLAWFSDLLDKSTMEVLNNQLNQTIQFDQTITTEKKLKYNELLIDNYLKLSNTQINNTIKLLKLIDEVAEPGNVKKKRKKKEIQESIQKSE